MCHLALAQRLGGLDNRPEEVWEMHAKACHKAKHTDTER